ncbi:hypothetical protein GCWU000325_00951 [Alloprevotella tannerae ATCC 51259]|uniref:Uncharacterized protein n=1 Tax=Alloprevotella tannerae ATCC 51259 TaxID=626522 RepID=C9LFH0_9BACT|nr:hypothetical protein GCWU000325_00951 [Alloprevotella tannerae ATCC 51259]
MSFRHVTYSSSYFHYTDKIGRKNLSGSDNGASGFCRCSLFGREDRKKK